MKKTILLLLLTSILLIQLVKAEFSFYLSEREIEILAGESKEVYVIIKNEMEKSDLYVISVWPNKFDEVTILQERYRVDLDPGEVSTTSLAILASEKAREISGLIKISVKSLNTGKTLSDILVISVKRKFVLALENLTLDKDSYKFNETLRADVQVRNFGVSKEKVSLEFTILKDEEKKFKELKEIELKAGEVKRVQFLFEVLIDHTPGKYEAKVSLLKEGKVVDSLSKNFYVERVATYTLKKVKSPLILGTKVDLIVENTGNYPMIIEVEEKIPRYLQPFLSFEIEPFARTEEKEELIFKWKVSVDPREKKIISYRILLYPVFLLGGLIAGFGYGAYHLTFAVSVNKVSFYKGPLTPKSKITVSLEIKNKRRKEVRNLVVEDFVPGIVKIVPEFGTIKPEIKKLPEGVSLKWKIPSLKSQEERVLTYSIRPVVKIIGSLRLPKAKVSYRERKRKRSVSSRSITIGE